MTTALVVSDTARRPRSEVAVTDLVTVALFGGVTSCARVMRITKCTTFVKLIGLDVPAPYRIGDEFALDHNKVIDW